MRDKIRQFLIALRVLQTGAYVETESIHASLFGGAVCDFSDSTIFKDGKKGDCTYEQKRNKPSTYNK